MIGAMNEPSPVAGPMIFLSAWTLLAYEMLPGWTGQIATWLLLGWLVLHLRRRLERRVGRRGLPLEMAPPV
jgi:hypothetical protein